MHIPLSTQARAILDEQLSTIGGRWLWPADRRPDEYASLSGAINWMVHVDEAAGFKTTRYDLRRTFITVAEALDISTTTIKRLAGHRVGVLDDVTSGYVVSYVPRLRRATQQISDRMFATIAGKEWD